MCHSCAWLFLCYESSSCFTPILGLFTSQCPIFLLAIPLIIQGVAWTPSVFSAQSERKFCLLFYVALCYLITALLVFNSVTNYCSMHLTSICTLILEAGNGAKCFCNVGLHSSFEQRNGDIRISLRSLTVEGHRHKYTCFSIKVLSILLNTECPSSERVPSA